MKKAPRLESLLKGLEGVEVPPSLKGLADFANSSTEFYCFDIFD